MIKEIVIQNVSNILIYLAVINVIGFLSMGFDKFNIGFDKLGFYNENGEYVYYLDGEQKSYYEI